MDIQARYQGIEERIQAACRRAGRDPDKVRLIAVSKKKPLADIMEAWGGGASDFGENYVQELDEKIGEWEREMPGKDIRWHMIGHLQKNKVKYLIGRVAMIHSVDTLGLAEKIEAESAKKDTRTDLLLEVNVAGEESKWGFTPETVVAAGRAIRDYAHVRLLGLMTSAPYTLEPEENRMYFRQLRELGMEMKALGLLAEGDGLPDLPVLSMGMSGDYEVAIEEGATMVRVGTAIFGDRTAPGK